MTDGDGVYRLGDPPGASEPATRDAPPGTRRGGRPVDGTDAGGGTHTAGGMYAAGTDTAGGVGVAGVPGGGAGGTEAPIGRGEGPGGLGKLLGGRGRGRGEASGSRGEASGGRGETSAGRGGPSGPQGPRPRRDPWKVLFAVLLILGLLAGAIWVLLGSRLLVVREVRVEGLKRVPRAEVTGVAAVPIGTPLARLDTGAIAARVEGVRLVESAEVVRSWPAAVTIRVTERRPVLAVRTGERYTLVDKVGVPVTRAARVPRGVPVLVVAGPVEGNPGVPVAVSITRRLPESLADRLVAVQITPGSSAITLRLRGGRTVVWGGAERTPEKARVLVGLLRAEPDARRFDVSDPAVAVVK